MATEWTHDANGKRYILDESLVVANCTMCGALCTRQKDAAGPHSKIRDTAAVINLKSFCECCFTSPEHP